MAGTKYQPDKFKELIVYLLQVGEGDERLGAVKLNKLLWYADKRAYLRSGHTITGARYIHLREGPAPAAMVPARDEMISHGRLRPDPRPAGVHTMHRLQAVEPLARLDVFAPEELADVHETVREYWYLDGSTMSYLSHLEAGWRVTKPTIEGEAPRTIPESMFWLSAAPLDEEQIKQGQELWQQLHG